MNAQRQQRGKFSCILDIQQEDLNLSKYLQPKITQIINKIDQRQEELISKLSNTLQLAVDMSQLSQKIKSLQQSNQKIMQGNSKILSRLFQISNLPIKMPMNNWFEMQKKRQEPIKMNQFHHNSNFSIDEQSDILDFNKYIIQKYPENMYDDSEEGSQISLGGGYQISEIFQRPKLLLRHLKNKLQEMSLNFIECFKIYDFPEMRDINFHQKIDRIKNIFFLAQLQNGQIIGAFTHEPFNPEPKYIPNLNPKSFICNLKKDIFIYAFKKNKTHFFDPNHIIFGNWEIKRLTGGQMAIVFLKDHFTSSKRQVIQSLNGFLVQEHQAKDQNQKNIKSSDSYDKQIYFKHPILIIYNYFQIQYQQLDKVLLNGESTVRLLSMPIVQSQIIHINNSRRTVQFVFYQSSHMVGNG